MVMDLNVKKCRNVVDISHKVEPIFLLYFYFIFSPFSSRNFLLYNFYSLYLFASVPKKLLPASIVIINCNSFYALLSSFFYRFTL